MSFKLGNKNKPVGSIKLSNGIELFYRKLTTIEILELQLVTEDFIDSIQQSYVKTFPLHEELQKAKAEFDDVLSKEDEYQYTEEDNKRLTKYIEIVSSTTREITKIKMFRDPSCISNIHQSIISFIVDSKGILDSNDTEHNFNQLSDENKLDVLESMTIEELNNICTSLINSSGLNPLE